MDTVLGTTFTVGVMLLAVLLVTRSRLPGFVRLMIYAGFLLRIVGTLLRSEIAADANVYYRWGRAYAEYFSRLDFSPIFEPQLWRGASWAGTNFVGYPAGAWVAILGPTRIGTFFGFTLLSSLGIVAFAVAYRRAFPAAPYARYWGWLLLLPSLWFWPSSIGKEALLVLGLGIATLGFVGNGKRANWLVTGVGLFLVVAVRPPVGAVFGLALVLSYWLDFDRWNTARAVQGIAILLFGLVVIGLAILYSKIAALQLAAIEGFVESSALRSETGGSAITPVGTNPSMIPLAFVNVLFRPFLWEVHNAAALASALEMVLIWGLVWLRRHQLVAVARTWRDDRVLRLAVPFTIVYVLALGVTLANLGIIARQRVLVFPFLFLLLEVGARPRLRSTPGARDHAESSPAANPRGPER